MIDRNRVGRSFHRAADDYDCHTPVQQRVLQQMLEMLSACDVGEPDALLDIGCGTGFLLERLQNIWPDSLLHGLDIAPNMLAKANQRLIGKATLVNGDAESLPFADGSFQLVLSSSTLQWLDSLDRCFAEVKRVLAPGGYFCFSFFGEGTLEGLRSSWKEALELSGKMTVNGHDGTHPFHSLNCTRDALESAGYRISTLFSVMETVWYPDLPRLLHAIKLAGAGSSRPPSGGGLGWRKVIHEMAAIYSGRFGTESGVPAMYEVIYCLCRV